MNINELHQYYFQTREREILICHNVITVYRYLQMFVWEKHMRYRNKYSQIGVVAIKYFVIIVHVCTHFEII